MNLGLEQRVVLVTGSSSGIGRATAELFGAEAARVIVTYRRNRTDAERAVEAVRRAGGEATYERLDLSDHDSIHSAIKAALLHWGCIDILVNNAVEWPNNAYNGPLETAPLAEWNHLLRTNVEGTLHAIQAVVPSMRAGGWGRILMMSSVAASDGMPGFAWYSAAKASLHGLTRTLARELGPASILVNTLEVGPTLTPRVCQGISDRVLKSLAAELPLRRLPTPEDVAAAAVFLCSERNTVITGEIVRASGGRK